MKKLFIGQNHRQWGKSTHEDVLESALLACMNNEALRRRPDVVKGVACDQRQLCICSLMQHIGGGGIDNLGAVHSVLEGPTECSHPDDVLGSYFSQGVEEGVAMSSDPDISRHTGKGSAFNMSGCDAENTRI